MIEWSEPVWETDPPAWVDRLLDLMLRAQRASENRCIHCGIGFLSSCSCQWNGNNVNS